MTSTAGGNMTAGNMTAGNMTAGNMTSTTGRNMTLVSRCQPGEVENATSNGVVCLRASTSANMTAGNLTAAMGCSPGYNRTCNVPLNATGPTPSPTTSPPRRTTTVPTELCAVLQSTQDDPQATIYVPASCSDPAAVKVSQIKGKHSINMTGTVPRTTAAAPNSALSPSPSSSNPLELNQIRNATFLKCSQSDTMKHCFEQELQLYGSTLEPGVRALVQCETQHSMDYCFSNAGPVTGNNVRTSSSPHIFSHRSGHTAAYNQGFSDGTTSARNSGINDPGSACDSYGYKGTDCSHYLQGYADGFNSNCSRSKFGCDSQGNPSLAPRK